MDDLISRQQAIKAIEEEWDGCCSEYPATQIIYDTTEAIEKLPSIQSEPHWIPVEQALPQIGEYVLCETTTRYFGKYHVCKFVDEDKWVDKPHFDWDRHGFPHVVAWTRFEPYKGMTE